MGTGGRVALVTGAGRGIGREIVLALARDGVDCAVSDVDAAAARDTVVAVEALGRRGLALEADVSDAAAVAAMVDRTRETLGSIRILVNNAGITRDGLLVRMKDEEWDRVLAVNLKGAFLCIRAVARGMMKERWGRIVNIASIVGAMGNAGQANYTASKAGLIGLTKTVARELASRGITCNAVAPGFIDTAMTQALSEEVRAGLLSQIPLGRLGTAADVAAAVCFLVSDQAAYITGQVLHVNGGMYM